MLAAFKQMLRRLNPLKLTTTNPLLHIAISSLLCATATFFLLKHFPRGMMTVKLNSIWEQLVWTARLHCSNKALPQSTEAWYDLDDVTANGIWELLRPFFESRGYILYRIGPRGFAEPCNSMTITGNRGHPFARPLEADIPDFIPSVSSAFSKLS